MECKNLQITFINAENLETLGSAEKLGFFAEIVLKSEFLG